MLQPINSAERIDQRSFQFGLVKSLWIAKVEQIGNFRSRAVEELAVVAHGSFTGLRRGENKLNKISQKL